MKAIALAALVFAASMAPCVGASYDDLNAGIAYWNKEEWDSAISRFDKAIAAGDLNTDLMRVAYFDRGIAHQRRSETDKAIADLSSALAMRPSHVETLIALASAYADANQPEKPLLPSHPRSSKIRKTTPSFSKRDWCSGNSAAMTMPIPCSTASPKKAEIRMHGCGCSSPI
jgi:tetratricopeptide (TPR) repeat protein